MKNFLRPKQIAAAVVLAAGFVSAASALPQFQVNPASLSGVSSGSFTADSIYGQAQTYLQITSASTIAGHGYLQFGLFYDGGTPTGLASDPAGTMSDYILWAEYSYTTKLTSGSIGAAGSNYDITALTMNFFAEKNDAGTISDSSFLVANAVNPASANVTHSADTVSLGSGTLVNGVAAFNSGGGTSFSPKLNLVLTPAGKNFFFDPDPFYPIAFTSATNTFQGFTSNAPGGSATIAGPANVDFNIPEPSSLALIGLGLLGLGGLRRHSKK